MITNNNRPIIGKIAKKCFRSNRNRNIVAIIAIMLTTILFTTVFTMGFGLIDTVKKGNIRKAGGDGQVILSNVTDKVFDDVKNNDLIDKIAYTKLVADEILNSSLHNLHTEMWYMDKIAIEFAGYDLVTGNLPVQKDEIIMSSMTLDALGYEKNVGEKIQIEYRVKDKTYKEEFILAGYWESDSISNVERIIVSEEYLKQYNSELVYTYNQDLNYSGSVSIYIIFKEASALENKITQLLEESGYVWDGTTTDKSADNYVIARISPAYQSLITWRDPKILGALAAVLLLIVITGYLIIYNIFQISVIQDIRFYGQLKTLGTTSKQIRRIIKKQVYLLSMIGIPAGLLLGYIIGNLLVPVLMQSTEYGTMDKVKMAVNPIIFIGAALFAFFTINISVSKPEKMASKVSPLEALKFVDNVKDKQGGKKSKRTYNGNKLYGMAFANLGRNKKRTALVILSLSLSVVLFNTVYTISNGFDEKKYIEKFVDKDFIISTVDYFNYNFETSDTDLSEEFIEYVKEQPEFEEGGKLITARVLLESFYAKSDRLSSYNTDIYGNPMIALYGMDNFLFKSMKIIEGSLDFEKLKSGKGVILGEVDDGTGKPDSITPISVGENLTIHYMSENGKEKTYDMEVIAKALIKENSYTTRQTGETNFYIPTNIFENMVEYPVIVSFPFNCKEADKNVESMQKKLEQYVETNSEMNFDSQATYVKAFGEIRKTFVVIGGAIGVIIACIGIINFLNAMITSTFTRKREFAMLQSVGMTGKQLNTMLCIEGLLYAVATIAISFVISMLFSFSIVRIISNNIWFFTFHFTLLPIMIISPLFIVISIIVPYILYKQMVRESVIERLRME